MISTCEYMQVFFISYIPWHVQKNDRVEELQGWVERHKFHIKELEVSFPSYTYA